MIQRKLETIILILCLMLLGCRRDAQIDRQLDEAENLMMTAPDSSLSILNQIQTGELSDKEQKARFALLKSMALDKNYIDTTTFDVLQPALDYYPKHGTADERLRTYYYEGRIHQNAGHNDRAMRSFLKGIDLGNEITDSLTFGNLLVAQGALFYDSYMMEDFYDNAIRSAEIYSALDDKDKTFGSQLRALHASMIMNDGHKADSLYVILKTFVDKNQEFKPSFLSEEGAYILRFGSIDNKRDLLVSSVRDSSLTPEERLNFAMGSVEIGEPKLAMDYFCSADTLGFGELGLMKYLIIGTEVYKSNGDYKRALESLWRYAVERERITLEKFESKSKVTQEKYWQERQNFEKLHQRDRWIIVGLILLIILLAIFLTSAYKLRISKTRRKNAELECERQRLMAENLQHVVSNLENETETLRRLLDNNESAQDPAVKNVIQQRFEMLNGLLAASISNNEAYSKPYQEWLEQETADKKKFMNSTRLALKGTHPAFIAYLEDHGLDENEINYLCLYAIGLKGKEVGNYMELRRHYNISSDIRKKLGIDEHQTNIGIYVRKLLKQL